MPRNTLQSAHATRSGGRWQRLTRAIQLKSHGTGHRHPRRRVRLSRRCNPAGRDRRSGLLRRDPAYQAAAAHRRFAGRLRAARRGRHRWRPADGCLQLAQPGWPERGGRLGDRGHGGPGCLLDRWPGVDPGQGGAADRGLVGCRLHHCLQAGGPGAAARLAGAPGAAPCRPRRGPRGMPGRGVRDAEGRLAAAGEAHLQRLLAPPGRHRRRARLAAARRPHHGTPAAGPAHRGARAGARRGRQAEAPDPPPSSATAASCTPCRW